jgi:hypothetical protein
VDTAGIELVTVTIPGPGGDDPINDRPIPVGTQVNHIFTATDASGNTTTDTIAAYYIPLDREAPVITSSRGEAPFDILEIDDTVNVCNTYPITLESLGLTATDNCTEELEISLILTDEFLEPLDSVDGPGVYLVQATTTDEAGNTGNLTIQLTLEANPDIFTVTAGDDNFTASAGQPFTFFAADLIGNDGASNGADLEVQDVALLNADDGTLADNGDGSYTFTPSPGFSGDVQLTYVVKSADESLYFPNTGNFYEFIPAPGISWEQARMDAEAKSLNGVNGYLATITSQAENDFIFSRLEGNGWIGASDAEEEGVWKWVTGPEAGQQFWQGSWAANGGTPVNGAYSNWDNSGVFLEPNNIGDEDYAHLAGEGENNAEAIPGTWNDFPNSTAAIRGYVVEYGGVDGCIPPGFTATGNITVSYPTGFASSEEGETVTAAVNPNPLLNSGTISVTVPENGRVDIEIRDLNGQMVRAASFDAFKGVRNDYDLQRGNLRPGMYFITVSTTSGRKTIRAVITE